MPASMRQKCRYILFWRFWQLRLLFPLRGYLSLQLKKIQSFTEVRGRFPRDFQNFVDAWETANMGSYMLNSVFVTVLGIVLLIVIALPAAYVLARFKFKSNKFWNVLFMAGLFINVNYIVVPIFLMLNDADAKLRQWFGAPFFLNNLFVLALVYASTALPFTIYLLSGYFKSLARVSGLQEIYTIRFGSSVTTEERNFSSLPARGGSINTTSAVSPCTAIDSINTPASFS